MFEDAVDNPGVESLHQRVLLERLLDVRLRLPEILPVTGQTQHGPQRVVGSVEYHGINADDGCHQPWMYKGQIDQTRRAHRVAHAHNWPWELVTELVNHSQQVARVVHEVGVVARLVFVEQVAAALVRNVCHPYAPDPPAGLGALGEQVVPQRLIKFFGECIGVGCDYRHVAWFRGRVVERDVLLRTDVQDIFLERGNGLWS